jgi:nitronate monooxygenase
MKTIPTRITKMFDVQYPLIAAPMFLVSNDDIVVETCEAGGLGCFPALNYRPIEKYIEAMKNIRARTKKPFGVNIIVNKSNARQHQDLKYALEGGVNFFITSLGNPKEVIAEAHKNGAKVFCDVTNLQFALKVQELGADGVIAVAAGAGGHAGPLSPFALIPWLKSQLEIPVIAAGAIANGESMAAALCLGADAVSVGTRFIASKEAKVEEAYKQAIVRATPEDIVMTTKISGTPAAVIRTPYIEKSGTELNWALQILKDHPMTKKWATLLIHYLGMRALENAAGSMTWKSVWSAGQSVGAVNEILSCREIVEKMVAEFEEAKNRLTTSSSDFSQRASAGRS